MDQLISIWFDGKVHITYYNSYVWTLTITESLGFHGFKEIFEDYLRYHPMYFRDEEWDFIWQTVEENINPKRNFLREARSRLWGHYLGAPL